MKKLDPITRLVIGALTAALGVVFVLAASLVPSGKLALLFLSSVVMWVPLNDREGMKTGLLCYIATTLLVFLIVPNKLYALFYALFFGLYSFVKLGVDVRVRDKFIAFLLKLIIMNVLAAAIILLGSWIMKQSLFSFIPEYPLYIMIAAFEVGFILFEILFSLCISQFDEHLRYVIIPRK